MRLFRYRAERRRCRDVLHSLDPTGLRDVESVRQLVQGRQGRPVHVLPVDIGPLPCGMWVVTARADFVFHTTATSALHQRHIVFHEFAHMLLGHDPAELTAEAASALGSGVSPDTAVRMLGRATYSSAAEREAELLATMMLQAPLQPGVSVREGDQGVRRLSVAMGDSADAD